jgi:hypothetical protein
LETSVENDEVSACAAEAIAGDASEAARSTMRPAIERRVMIEKISLRVGMSALVPVLGIRLLQSCAG